MFKYFLIVIFLKTIVIVLGLYSLVILVLRIIHKFSLIVLHDWIVINIEFCLSCILLRYMNFFYLKDLWYRWNSLCLLFVSIMGPASYVKTLREIHFMLTIAHIHLCNESKLHPLSTSLLIFAQIKASSLAILSSCPFLS